MSEFTKTEERLNSLITTTTTGWSSPFGVTVGDIGENAISSSIESVTDTAKDYISNLSDQLAYVGSNLVDAFTDSDQYLKVADAAGSSVLGYLESKVAKLKEALLKKEQMSLGALLAEVAPYALDFKKSIKLVGDKMTDLAEYAVDYVADALGIEGDFDDPSSYATGLLEDFTNYMSSSDELTSAVAELSAVKAFAGGMQAVTKTLDVVSKILPIIEKIMPYLEIATNFAEAYWTCGASIPQALNKIGVTAENIVQKVLTFVFYILRTFLFDKIMLTLPAILVGAINTVSIADEYLEPEKDASGNVIKDEDGNIVYKYGDKVKLYSEAFSSDYFKTTGYNSTWAESISKASKKVSDWSDKVKDFEKMEFFSNESEIGKSANKFLQSVYAKAQANSSISSDGKIYISRETYLLVQFTRDVIEDTMTIAIRKARKAAGIVDYTDASRIGWNNYTNNGTLSGISLPEITSSTGLDSTISKKSMEVLLADESDVGLFNFDGSEDTIRIVSGKLIEVM